MLTSKVQSNSTVFWGNYICHVVSQIRHNKSYIKYRFTHSKVCIAVTGFWMHETIKRKQHITANHQKVHMLHRSRNSLCSTAVSIEHTHTHTLNTYPEQWEAIFAATGYKSNSLTTTAHPFWCLSHNQLYMTFLSKLAQ